MLMGMLRQTLPYDRGFAGVQQVLWPEREAHVTISRGYVTHPPT